MHPASVPYLLFLLRNQWRPRARIEARQWRAFERVLRHAYEQVPFYRRKFDAARIRPQDVREPADLQRVPITSREELLATPLEDRLAAGVNPSRCITRRTSGTSGKPLPVLLTRREREAQDMAQARALIANGLRLTDRRAVWVAPWQIPARAQWFQQLGVWRKSHFSVFDDLRGQIDTLVRLAPESLAATPAVLDLIAAEKSRRGLAALAPRTLFSASDLLDVASRQRIESAFSVAVSDHYGSLEFGYMAWQCPQREGYHVNTESVLLELPPATGAQPSSPAGTVCTSLTGYAMPLVRYQTDDILTPATGHCACGRGLPRIALLRGRTNDVIWLDDGRAITPQAVADALVAVGDAIGQFRVVQHAHDRIELSLVPGAGFDAAVARTASDALRGLVGHGVTIELSTPDAIPLDPSGKRRAVVSHVDAPSRDA